MGSKVHENLYLSLDKFNINQDIYYPIRKQALENDDEIKDDLDNKIVTSEVLQNYHRLFFNKKIAFLYQDLKLKTDLNGYDIVHATTLFSDGAIALKIWKEYRVPYILAVRGTDVNLFLKFRYDLYFLGKEIISNAKQIIFISNSLKNNFNRNIFIKSWKKSIFPDIKIIYNGIDSYWINNLYKRRELIKPINFLYIGKFNSNKNVIRLIRAFLKVNSTYGNLKLNLVGKGGNQEKEVKRLSEIHKGQINFHGPIYSPDKLKQMYRNNDVFAMTSIGETFGLVYVEALTQGLPLLYTQNQGIDGTFEEYVGESVNPKSIQSIASGIEKIIKNYSQYEIDKIDFSKFNWENIAKSYIDLYNKLSKK